MKRIKNISFSLFNMENERIEHINIFRWLQYERKERIEYIKNMSFLWYNMTK